jgi:hypothetical protein
MFVIGCGQSFQLADVDEWAHAEDVQNGELIKEIESLVRAYGSDASLLRGDWIDN